MLGPRNALYTVTEALQRLFLGVQVMRESMFRVRCYNQLNVVRPRHPTPCKPKTLLFWFHQKTKAQGFSATLAVQHCHHRGGSSNPLIIKATLHHTQAVCLALSAECQPTDNHVTLRGRHCHLYFTDEGMEAPRG